MMPYGLTELGKVVRDGCIREAEAEWRLADERAGHRRRGHLVAAASLAARLRGVLELIRLDHTVRAHRAKSEYYAVDGHHRVAMAREFGKAFLDANAEEFNVSDPSACE